MCGAPALDPLFDEPKKAIKLAFDRGRGGEPVIEVPMELAVAKGTALSVDDTKALRDFTGRYDDCGSNGVVVKRLMAFLPLNRSPSEATSRML